MSLAFFSQIKILTFGSVESTNSLAMKRLKNDEAQNGDIIKAGYQSAGKGQAQNTWFSTDGNNLLVSIICKNIHLKATELPKLNMLVSLAVHHCVDAFFYKETYIKWPNDILVNEKKIAGVLIETMLQGEYIKNAVIGIGLNVNEEIFPDDLTQACSFFTLTNKYYDLDSLLITLVEQLDIQLSKLRNADFEAIKKEYERVLFGMDTKRYFRIAHNKVEGKIKGINAIGQLCVEIDNELKTFNNKEIEFKMPIKISSYKTPKL
jgi:BirA family biotin operon repressor/biotin-[acetyl-CoA-carboxylase] ligase